MRKVGPVLLALIGQVPSDVSAFVVPVPPRVPGDDHHSVGMARPAEAGALNRSSVSSGLSGLSLFAGAALAGAIAAISTKKARKSKTEMGVLGCWKSAQQPEEWRKNPPKNGRLEIIRKNMRHQFMKGAFKMHQRKSVKKFAQAGITYYKEGWTKWYPKREEFNMYKGPESAKDNPWFPAPSGGKYPGRLDAVSVVSHTGLAAVASAGTLRGAFAGKAAAPSLLSAKRSPSGTRAARKGLVLHAHKKAAASSKNQGFSPGMPKPWGIQRGAYHGAEVKVGQALFRQLGTVSYPGANVGMDRAYKMYAKKWGILQIRGEKKHREFFVVPMEYVEKKCRWINRNTLGPKEYEPWMGNTENTCAAGNPRRHINAMREVWLQSDDGKEWQAKKDAKKAKSDWFKERVQAIIAKKPKSQEKVLAGDMSSDESGSESEKE